MEKVRKRAYSTWRGIYNRCYCVYDKEYKNYGAKGVRMCTDWTLFEGFYKWYEANYYEVKGEYMAIDKDIRGGDSMLYSPSTCLIVPFRINGMFVHKKGGTRGIQAKRGKYEVKVRNTLTGENEYHGLYTSLEVAQNVYKECKLAIIRGVVEDYGDKLPPHVRQAILDYRMD